MKYQIWDKKSQVITPIGEVLTAEQWMDRYPMSKLDNIDLVIGGGTINGSFCAEYTSFVELNNKQMKSSNIEGYTTGIADDLSQQEVLDMIEAFEDARNSAASSTVSVEERIAAALEAQVMMALPDSEG